MVTSIDERRSASTGEGGVPSKNAASLIDSRGLTYDETVDPTPRNACENEWWRKIVGLFQKELKYDDEWTWEEEENLGHLTCPEGLKNAMRNPYAKEHDFNVALFDALRTGLAGSVSLFPGSDELGDSIEPEGSYKKSVKDNDSSESDESVKPRKRRKEEKLDEDYVDPNESKPRAATSSENSPDKTGLIIFANGITEKYAIGIKREVNGEQTHGKTKLIVGEPSGTHSGISASAKADQGVCLLEKDKNGKWIVMDCLSIVELKMAGCKSLDHCASGKAIARALGERFAGRSAIAQVMLYTMAWVVPSLAKLGQLGNDVPWAVLAGNRVRTPGSTSPDPNLNGWVSGKIVPPNKCGYEFHYAVTGFERFQTTIDGNNNFVTSSAVVDRALSVYFETLHFGLKAAKKWLCALENGQPCGPLAASGKKVMLRETELPGLTLCGSPYLRSDGDDDFVISWKLNQGEMFIGPLNLSILPTDELPEESTENPPSDESTENPPSDESTANPPSDESTENPPANDFVAFRHFNDNEVVDVAVKVSSKAVHGYLTLPTTAFAALAMIKSAENQYMSEMEIFMLKREQGKRPKQVKAPKPPDISDVLLAVHKTGLGLITIMVDLSKQGFVLLKPEKCNQHAFWRGVSLAHLWGAFLNLLKTVLIPMANLGIIHPDIRPGFNVTSNILVKFERSNDVEQQLLKVVMKLIDYESIKLAGACESTFVTDHRYVRLDGYWTAPNFLWWQCALIAYAWKNSITQEGMANTDVQSELSLLKTKNYLQNEPERTGWLVRFGTKEQMTHALASKLSGLF